MSLSEELRKLVFSPKRAGGHFEKRGSRVMPGTFFWAPCRNVLPISIPTTPEKDFFSRFAVFCALYHGLILGYVFTVAAII